MIAPKIRAIALIGLACASVPTVRANDYWSICSTDAKAKLRDTFRSLPAVFVAGGTDPKAPCAGNVLPDDIYYFQVTTPSGSLLLSTDPIDDRRILVFANRFAGVPAGGHATRVGPCNSVIVQLSPYLPTPDPGGEYKIWLTPVDKYDPTKGVFGFQPAFSETDNFIVRFGPLPEQTTIRGKVFYDFNRNGIHDSYMPEEVPLSGWKIQLSSSGPPGDADTTFSDNDGHFEFLRDQDLTSYTVTSVAPAPGFIPAVGGRWLATTPNPVSVVADVPTRTVDFANLYFVHTPQLAHGKLFWHNRGWYTLRRRDPQWREFLNSLCLRTNQTSPPNSLDATLFQLPLLPTDYTTAFTLFDTYLVGTPDYDVLSFELSTQFAAAMLNYRFGSLRGVPTYIDQLGDDVLVPIEAMIAQTSGILCDPRSADTGPGGDPAWRDTIQMRMNEWVGMNSGGSNLFTHSKLPGDIAYP